MMANPTLTSAAATTIIKKTNICPLTSPRKEEKATNERLIEFNINSIDIKIIIAFLLTRTPTTPIQNNTVLKINI